MDGGRPEIAESDIEEAKTALNEFLTAIPDDLKERSEKSRETATDHDNIPKDQKERFDKSTQTDHDEDDYIHIQGQRIRLLRGGQEEFLEDRGGQRKRQPQAPALPPPMRVRAAHFGKRCFGDAAASPS